VRLGPGMAASQCIQLVFMQPPRVVDSAAVMLHLHHRSPGNRSRPGTLYSFFGKGAFFVKAYAYTTLMHSLAKQPGGSRSSNSGRGPAPFRKSKMALTVSVKLSPIGAQPGTLMTGKPKAPDTLYPGT